ncbi:MAG: methylmalonyl-CoA epimerase [Deltaproteobacteria bacterium]|nr:methylmalonyl-CoA epimerase [Deltaproteobacteria bacterium]
MKVNKIDHICIAVKDLEAAKKIWEPMLGKAGPDDAYVDEPEKINVFNVDNTRDAVDELKAKDYPFIPAANGEIARPFRDCEFAFIHPKKLNGVLTELIDYKWEEFKK